MSAATLDKVLTDLINIGHSLQTGGKVADHRDHHLLLRMDLEQRVSAHRPAAVPNPPINARFGVQEPTQAIILVGNRAVR